MFNYFNLYDMLKERELLFSEGKRERCGPGERGGEGRDWEGRKTNLKEE